MHRLLPILLSRQGLPEGSLLRKTLFGTHAALLGLDAQGIVVLHQLLRRDDSLVSRERHDPLPVIDYPDSHPVALDFMPHAALRSGLIYFKPAGALPSTGRTLLDDAPQMVSAWCLVGIDDTVTEELSGAGLFGVGTLIGPDAADTAREEGRLWVQWTAEPSLVGQHSALPFSAMDPMGQHPRQALTALADVATDPITYVAGAHTVGSSAQLCFDTRALFRDASKDHYLRELTSLGRRVNERASHLMHAQFGDDASRSPLTTLPEPEAVLFDVTDSAPPFIRDFYADGADVPVVPACVSLASNAVIADAGDPAPTLRHNRSFELPVDRGIKFTVRVRYDDASGTGRMGLKLCSAGGPVTEAASLLELVCDPAMDPTYRVSTYTGAKTLLDSYYARAELTRETGRSAQVLKGQRYEVYLFPDRQAYVYANGMYLHRITVPAFLYEPGRAYTLAIAASQGQLTLKEAKVEQFVVPDDYLTPDDYPSRPIMPDLSAVQVDPKLLTDGTTTVPAFTTDGGQLTTVEFTLSERGRFRIHGALEENGRISAGRQSHYPPASAAPCVVLERIDGFGTYEVTTTSLNGWYEFPGTLESGRYRLSVPNFQWTYRWCADWYWVGTSCWEWRNGTAWTKHRATLNEWEYLPLEEVTDQPETVDEGTVWAQFTFTDGTATEEVRGVEATLADGESISNGQLILGQ